MAKTTTLVTSFELHKFAESLGYGHMEALSHIDRFIPCYEVSSYDYSIEEFDDEEEYDEHERAIMKGFFKHLGVEQFTLVQR